MKKIIWSIVINQYNTNGELISSNIWHALYSKFDAEYHARDYAKVFTKEQGYTIEIISKQY